MPYFFAFLSLLKYLFIMQVKINLILFNISKENNDTYLITFEKSKILYEFQGLKNDIITDLKSYLSNDTIKKITSYIDML